MDYIEKARFRAKRRKSAWNLLLLPAIITSLCALWVGSYKVLNTLHSTVHPGQNFGITGKGLGAVLAAVTPFFGALPVAMIIGNFLVWLIPPARKALDEEAKPFPSTSFINAQKQLLKLAYVLVPVSLALGILGALMPWYS
ncbi:hypothetical protein [Geomonas propionica]|uniref:Uncharacterized protein n=1 Tax=Geomonas propionica TaxID=2798582 RepID=A0ABS0YXY9_9BACT|nr:hypothetical protein [Geomonas propionica]MBJ6802809.1 hypothetical protein [Geomonas propionica]